MQVLRIKLVLLIAFAISLFFINNALAQTVVKTKDRIYYITDTTSNFDTLISRFKGRIIYIDMWATWCHPCRMELQDKKAITEFAQYAEKNNIIRLYICCDKDGKTWKRFISTNKLTGYHIRINDTLNKELHTRFSYSQTGKIRLKWGFYIPRHMIIDNTGAIADSLAGPQGGIPVYTRLNKLLGAKND